LAGCKKGGLLGCHVDVNYVKPALNCSKQKKATHCWRVNGCIVEDGKCIDPTTQGLSEEALKKKMNGFCATVKKCASKTCLKFDGNCVWNMSVPEATQKEALRQGCAKATKCKGACKKVGDTCTHSSLIVLSEHAKFCKSLSKCEGSNGTCKYVKKQGCLPQAKRTPAERCATDAIKCQLDDCIPSGKTCIVGDRCTLLKPRFCGKKNPDCMYTNGEGCHKRLPEER